MSGTSAERSAVASSPCPPVRPSSDPPRSGAPRRAPTWHALALRRWEQGRLDAAADALLRARALAPADITILATQRSLCEYRARWARSSFPCDHGGSPTGVALLPAHPRFAEGLHREGRDGEVAGQAGLPAWASAQEAALWIAELCRHPAHLLGIAAHRSAGVVGAVSLRRAGGSALLAYFLGPRFHGRGWGRHLVREARDLARSAGVETLWAFVRPSNVASARALAAAGFVAAPVLAATPQGALTVHLAGPEAPRGAQAVDAAWAPLARALHLAWQLEPCTGGPSCS